MIAAIENNKKKPGLSLGGKIGLDLSKVNGKKTDADFQDEFMAMKDEFSESWRKMIEQ